jgi:Holliday junction resolvase-like predicted endonuclease
MSKFQTKIINKYKSFGYIVLNAINISDKGYPDLILCKDGKTTFIEVKEGKDTLKPLQKLRIDKLIQQGFTAFAIHDQKGVIYGSDENFFNYFK